MKTMSKSQPERGFTLTEIMIVVAIIALLATLAVPSVAKARDSARLNVIYSNLRQIEEAKDQWALATGQATGAPVDSLAVLSDFLHGGAVQSVMGETYLPNTIGAPAEADLPNGVRLGPYGPGAAIPAQ